MPIMDVDRPKKQESGLSKILGIGKVVAGAITGNPAIAASGAGDVMGGPAGKAIKAGEAVNRGFEAMKRRKGEY